MKLELDFSLAADVEARLAEALGCKTSELAAKVKPYAYAALQEYVDMFVGDKLVTSGADLRTYRLYRIAAASDPPGIPDDDRVAALFQLTPTQSRNLIDATLAKYQYRLERNLAQAMFDAINDEKDEYEFAPSLVEAMNRRAQRIDKGLEPIRKSKTGSRYVVPVDTRTKLLKDLGKNLGK